MGPWTLASPGETMRLMSWPDGVCYSCPLQSLVIFPSDLSYPLFLDWRRTVSSKFFDTQAPSIATNELVLPRHSRCVLSRLRCNGHSLLSSCLFGRIENSSCRACGHSSQDTSYLIPHCPATDSAPFTLAALCRCTTSGPDPGAPWSSAMPPSLGRGGVATTTAVWGTPTILTVSITPLLTLLKITNDSLRYFFILNISSLD